MSDQMAFFGENYGTVAKEVWAVLEAKPKLTLPEILVEIAYNRGIDVTPGIVTLLQDVSTIKRAAERLRE